MTPVETVIVAGVDAAVLYALCNTYRLPRLGRRIDRARAERAVAKQHNRYRRFLRTGHVTRATRRALHNDFDSECVYWFGDRHPERNDSRNRELDGEAATMDARRCLVCRPRDHGESEHALAVGAAFDDALEAALNLETTRVTR